MEVYRLKYYNPRLFNSLKKGYSNAVIYSLEPLPKPDDLLSIELTIIPPHTLPPYELIGRVYFVTNLSCFTSTKNFYCMLVTILE